MVIFLGEVPRFARDDGRFYGAAGLRDSQLAEFR